MEHSEHVDHLRHETEALAKAAAAAGVEAAVPSCPDWTVAQLLTHIGIFDAWVRSIVEQRATEAPKRMHRSDVPQDDRVIPWYLEQARALADTLAGADPTVPVYTFVGTQPVGWWSRRRANETSVHRYDAQLAAGMPAPIDADLAADGIDEYLTTFVPFFAEQALTVGSTLHFHCTDVEGEWLVTRDDAGIHVTREHAKGDVAVRGPASSLVLYIWGRVPRSELEVFGDESLLDMLRAGSTV